MSVAVTSLPVPLSPVISTVLSLLPITRRNSNTARIRALRPTTMESSMGAVMAASHHAQGLEFRNLFAKGGLDAEIEGHVRARAPGAHPGQLDVRRIPGDVHQLDVAAVGLHEWPDSIQHRFDSLS